MFLTPEVRNIILSYYEGLNCPRSLTAAILLRHDDWVALAKLSATPTDYPTANSYIRAAAASDLLRKLELKVPGLDPEQAAKDKWIEAERQCFWTNRRLNEIADFGTHGGSPVSPRILHFISETRRNLEWLIGSRPPGQLEGRFGPGATVSDRSGRTSVPHKMSTPPTLTRSATYYLVPWVGTKWSAAVAARSDDISFVKGNIFFTVPKTSLTHRPCAKEPSINGFYQLGVGSAMRQRLKIRGIDLEHGQWTHRQVACSSSETGSHCTIDLSSASDTLSESLVRILLPDAWYAVLSDLRSAFTRVDGKWHRLEKFSSMGNGFTFELETAIFTALCMTASGHKPGPDLLVYGDDIIVPSDKASDVIAALSFFGFTTNVKKTFVDGPFRESCGGDYFMGKSVRGHFLKELPNEPQHFIALANGIRRVSNQLDQISLTGSDLRRAWFACLDQLPSAIRSCRGPESLGDICIHDWSERWSARWRSSIRYVKVYRPTKPNSVSFGRFDPDVQFAAALYGVGLQGPILSWPDGYDGRRVSIRGAPQSYKVGWVPFS